jgi:hypothetical protein
MKTRSVGVRSVWDSMLWVCVSEVGGVGKGADSETLLSYILRYISLAELDTLCRVGLRDPMHLCTCVNEEGGDLCTCVNEEGGATYRTYVEHIYILLYHS